jgi:hypothetical protein
VEFVPFALIKHGMRGDAKSHWGNWIGRRSEFVGFQRQIDFAEAVGCTRERIVKWLKLATPPLKMRKGFDRSLARALRVTTRMIFVDYANTDPQKAVEVSLSIDHLSPEQQRSDFAGIASAQVESIVREIGSRLSPSESEQWVLHAIAMLQNNDPRRPEFEQFARQLSLLLPYPTELTSRHRPIIRKRRS